MHLLAKRLALLQINKVPSLIGITALVESDIIKPENQFGFRKKKHNRTSGFGYNEKRYLLIKNYIIQFSACSKF